MKLKTIEIDGVTYAVLDSAGLPVYTHDDGKEIGFDAPGANSRITALNAESAGRRTELTQANERLKAFEGIDDPDAAKKALKVVENLDAGKLIEAGKVEEVKQAAIMATEEKNKAQITALTEQNQQLQADNAGLKTVLDQKVIGGAFSGSKYVEDKLILPDDAAEALFGKHFKCEDGVAVAYDSQGGKIYSRKNPGALADFDEALEIIVGTYPKKDQILKGDKGAGGGAGQGDNKPDANEPNPWKGTSLNRTEQARIVRDDPVKAKRLMLEAGVPIPPGL